MRIYRVTRMNLPKIAVLATGLAAAILVATTNTEVAQAHPSQKKDCANCHTASTSTATTAAPSTTTPAAGATYTVAITLAANPTGGKSGYAIVPVTASTGTTSGGDTASDLAYTATMTAPSAAGTYSYTVFTNVGSQSSGQTGSAVYSINVTAGSTAPPATTLPPTTPAATTLPPLTPPATAPPVTNPPVTNPPVIGSASIHGPYALNAPECGICHRTHTAQAPKLLAKGSQSALCFACHDGTGANANVQAQYALVRPVNNPATREYYSHDALAPSTHTDSGLDEFGGVSNRHSECSDCHNAHKAKTADATQAADGTGWEPSGKLAGVSGVSVVNGAAENSTPAYTFLDGVNNLVTREYQLCFKCHSGSTTLTSNAGLKPSQYALDKAVELNPANPSFHPVEAAGKNQTAAMEASLKGSSPYKVWNFNLDSTVRCLNCHASGTTPDTTPTPLPQPGSALAPHTSANRGILLKNYRDRVLKSTNEAYSAGDFALCYMCHAEAPFLNSGSNATNFDLHAKHVSSLEGGSGGTNIDTPGAGGSNALCAECHFRLHSTTNKVAGQTVPGTRLVNFAPNVQPLVAGGTLSWTQGTTGSGSCTLTCHGQKHDGFGY
jgi:predicted CXXCH cytochrome family protein